MGNFGIANQLGKGASSIAAHYRGLQGRFHTAFVAKIGIVEEEADESTLWLDILPDTKNAEPEEVDPLLKEARELTAIFTAANKTAKKNKWKQQQRKFFNSSIPKFQYEHK